MSLTPCKPGQERNPETNRCRALASTAAAQLKPCAPGQERNPATNRCRKAGSPGSAGAAGSVKDVASDDWHLSTNWWFAGIAVTGIVGYGLWEWRRDIMTFVSKLGQKITPTAS